MCVSYNKDITGLRGTVRIILTALVVLAAFRAGQGQGKEHAVTQATSYRRIQIDGLTIFYREAGPKNAPILLLLHGLPSSSRMFEPLLARLSDRCHLIAPDYPGFGHSDWPDPKKFRVHVRSHRRDNESFHGSARAITLLAFHAGLRWPGRFPHGFSASGSDRPSDRPECGGARLRPGPELEDAARVLGRPGCQRRCASRKSLIACGNADAARRERSKHRAL